MQLPIRELKELLGCCLSSERHCNIPLTNQGDHVAGIIDGTTQHLPVIHL